MQNAQAWEQPYTTGTCALTSDPRSWWRVAPAGFGPRTGEAAEPEGVAVVVVGLLRVAHDELDVVVVGRRLPSEQVGIGAAFSKLARKCPCSVLVVPSHARVHLSRMLVPVDFSEHSKLALEQAIDVARRVYDDTDLLEPEEEDEYLVRVQTEQGWVDEWLVPPPQPPARRPTPAVDARR